MKTATEINEYTYFPTIYAVSTTQEANKHLSVFLRALFSLKASKKLCFVILLKNIIMLSGTTSVEQRDLVSKNLQFLSLANVKPQSQSCNKDLVNKFG